MPCVFVHSQDKQSPNARMECQFKESESVLVDFDGQTWCRFHLPMSNGQGETSAKSQWSDAELNDFDIQIGEIIRDALKKQRPADLCGVSFPRPFDFRKAIENRQDYFGLNLQDATFHGRANFNAVVFHREAAFSRADFKDGAIFANATFREAAFWNGIHANGIVDFSQAKFEKLANFVGAEFATSLFNKAQFATIATFEAARFRAIAEFYECDFGIRSNFRQARFAKADFSCRADARVDDVPKASMPAGTTFPRMDFSQAKFDGHTTFSNRTFSNSTSFASAAFRSAPEFFNCEFHQDLDFSATRFFDTTSSTAPRAYRSLRYAMQALRARDEEASFYALEMRSRRRQRYTPLSVKLFSWLYESLADYGHDFMKPLVWLAGSVFIYLVLYLVLLGINPVEPSDLSDALLLSLRQIVRPFFILSEDYLLIGRNTYPVPFLLALLAFTQSLVSASLAALFVIGLRRRFRMA